MTIRFTMVTSAPRSVSLLAHLHKNKIALHGVGERDLYDLVLDIANHAVIQKKTRRRSVSGKPHADDEIAAIAHWIKKRSRSILRGERQITYRQLRQILEHFDFTLRSPKGNAIDIYRIEETPGVFLGRTKVEVRIGAIPFPGDNTLVSVTDIKLVRRICRLTAEDGIDSEGFYGQGQPIDAFIIQHRDILYKLANK